MPSGSDALSPIARAIPVQDRRIRSTNELWPLRSVVHRLESKAIDNGTYHDGNDLGCCSLFVRINGLENHLLGEGAGYWTSLSVLK